MLMASAPPSISRSIQHHREVPIILHIFIFALEVLTHLDPEQSTTPSATEFSFTPRKMPYLDRDGVKLYYEVHMGNGPPLLLSHGYSSTSAMWAGQIAALSKNFKLIIWDMRGHGNSDYPEDQSAYSEAHTVKDMAALLDETCGASGKAIVGGLSLGGYMSLAFNRVYPQRVLGLLIIDTVWVPLLAEKIMPFST